MERAYLKNIDNLLGFSFSKCELQVPAKIGIIDVTNTDKFLKYRPTLTGTKKLKPHHRPHYHIMLTESTIINIQTFEQWDPPHIFGGFHVIWEFLHQLLSKRKRHRFEI